MKPVSTPELSKVKELVMKLYQGFSAAGLQLQKLNFTPHVTLAKINFQFEKKNKIKAIPKVAYCNFEGIAVNFI